MSGLRKVAARKTFGAIAPSISQQNMAALETPEDLQSQWEGQRSVDLTARLGSFRSSEIDADGFPKHLSAATNGLGIFVRVTSRGAGLIVAVSHTLGIVPQGIIWIKQPTSPSYLVMSYDSGFMTTDTDIAVKMAGPSGEEGIGLIF